MLAELLAVKARSLPLIGSGIGSGSNNLGGSDFKSLCDFFLPNGRRVKLVKEEVRPPSPGVGTFFVKRFSSSMSVEEGRVELEE